MIDPGDLTRTERPAMPTPLDGQTYSVLSAMITPALFMGGNGSLIISTSNRMSRIVDRIRVLNDLGDALCRGASPLDYVEERQGLVSRQLDHLEWRSDRVRYALTMLYLSFAMFVGTSLTLAIDSLLHNRVPGLPTSLSMAGVILMLGASVNLIREAHRALRSNREETRFYRELRDKRQAAAFQTNRSSASVDGMVDLLNGTSTSLAPAR